MQDLKALLTQLEKNRAIHISILDLNGILSTSLTRIEFKNAMHSKKFCDIAKSTARGYEACLRCKRAANGKAIHQKQAYSGYCLYGLYEAAYPVMINGEVGAIVYVGNAVIDPAETQKRIKRACGYTGVDEGLLLAELTECEYLAEHGELLQIAEIVADYIKLLYSAAPREEQRLHWIVSLLKHHADERYCSALSLGELALTYQKNQKYIGRLFKEQMGMSFSEYYTQLRIKRAERLLVCSSDKIIDIALDCGFNNVSYFNRVFYRTYGVSPSAYRKQMTRKA